MAKKQTAPKPKIGDRAEGQSWNGQPIQGEIIAIDPKTGVFTIRPDHQPGIPVKLVNR